MLLFHRVINDDTQTFASQCIDFATDYLLDLGEHVSFDSGNLLVSVTLHFDLLVHTQEHALLALYEFLVRLSVVEGSFELRPVLDET